MKRLATSYKKDFPPVRLYKEDVQEICRLMLQLHTSCCLKTADHELDSSEIDEYAKIHPSIATLEITGSGSVGEDRVFGSRVDVQFCPNYAHIHVARPDDAEAVGIAVQMAEVIAARKAWFGFTTSGWFYFIGLAVIGSLGITFSLLHFPVAASAAYLAMEVFVLGMMFLLFYVWQHKYSVLYLCNSHDKQQSFFRRRKDEIAMVVITAVITAVITNYFTSTQKNEASTATTQPQAVVSSQPTTSSQPASRP